jgi:hypothetical protein
MSPGPASANAFALPDFPATTASSGAGGMGKWGGSGRVIAENRP